MKTSVIVGTLAVLAACSSEVGQTGSGSGSTASGTSGPTGSTTGAGGSGTSGATGAGVTVGTTSAGATSVGATTTTGATTSAGTTTGESTASGAGGTGGTSGAGGGSAGSGGSSVADAGMPRDAGGKSDAAVTPGGTNVVMYLPNWSGSFATWATKIDFNKMTHLLLAFGVVDTNNNWNLGAADNDVKTLTAAAHAKNVKVLVSIGGADDDIGIMNQYATQSNIAPLVANLDAFAMRLNLDGVDVDLERGAMMKSTGNYPAFVNKLIAVLHPEGKLVTTALAQYIVQDAGLDANLKTVLSSFDLVNLMIYSTSANTYTSQLNWWTTNTGVAKDKLVWGIDFSTALTPATAAQFTTSSKAYGGIMMWEYSQRNTVTLWPAVQGAL